MSTAGLGAHRHDFPHGIMFHRFRASSDASRLQGALTPEELERMLRFVGIDRILAPGEWMARVANHRLEPTDVCLTFDDGLRSQLLHALPVLEHFHLTAFWFVSSCVFAGQPINSEIYTHVAARSGGMALLIQDFLTRCPRELVLQLASPHFEAYADWMRREAPFYSEADLMYRYLRNRAANTPVAETIMDELIAERGLSRETIARDIWLSDADLVSLAREGHCVGMHSYDHPYEMASLSREEQWEQYRRNATHIERVTGTFPTSMSHPLNSYSDVTLEVLDELGVRCGFRATMSAPADRLPHPHPLALPREDAGMVLAVANAGTR